MASRSPSSSQADLRERFDDAASEAVLVEELLPRARALAAEIARKSPIALRLAKESLNRTEYLPFKEAYRTEQDYTARLRAFADSAEVVQAFLERREPQFRWR